MRVSKKEVQFQCFRRSRKRLLLRLSRRLIHPRPSRPPPLLLLARSRYLQAQKAGRSKQHAFVSPLYETHWRRVSVDEVQDVEGQTSAAAKMLRALQTQQRCTSRGCAQRARETIEMMSNEAYMGNHIRF